MMGLEAGINTYMGNVPGDDQRRRPCGICTAMSWGWKQESIHTWEASQGMISVAGLAAFQQQAHSLVRLDTPSLY
eukprot:1155402-Pelagomonas_calceolata.AAC.6